MSKSSKYFLWVQLISLLGSELSYVAAGYAIYQKSRQVSDFALILVLSFLPNIIGFFLSGPIVDRTDFKKLYGISDALSAIVLTFTALFIKLDEASFGLYFALFLSSLISAFQMVALRSYLPEIYKDEELVKANSLLSIFGSSAAVAAPAFSGFLITIMPLKAIFLIDGASFVFSLLTLIYFVPSRTISTTTLSKGFIGDFKQGVEFISNSETLRTIILTMVLFNIFSAVNTVLVTPLLLDSFESKTAGFMLGLVSLGSLSMSFLVNQFPKLARRYSNLILLSILVSFANIGVAMSSQVWAISFFLLLIGVCVSHVGTVSSLVFQESVESGYRGRVFAFSRAVSWIGIPFAQIMVGKLADSGFLVDLVKLNQSKNNFLLLKFNFIAVILFFLLNFLPNFQRKR